MSDGLAMAGPLAGIKVVELTTMITGPLAGMLLGDLGAEIVKVENPEGGDPFRSYGGGAYSAQFCAYNRNKRSVVLPLRSDLGRQALAALAARSDVLITNFRAGVLDRLGFDDARLQALNPRLVRCAITGFGPDGPYAAQPCYDGIAQALSGMSSQFLDPEDPRLTGTTIADNVTGQYAAYGVLAALLERGRTGLGRRVEVNMLEATMAFMPEPFGYHTQNGDVADAYLRVRNSQAYVFTCADGKMVAIHLSSQQKFWQQLCAAIERPALAEDPRFAALEARVANYDALRREVAAVFATQPRATWLVRFDAYDVPFKPVYQIPEVFDDAQVRHLDAFMALDHPVKGRLTGIRRPVRFDGRRDDQSAAAPPMLGEHTAAVLGELGLLEAARAAHPEWLGG